MRHSMCDMTLAYGEIDTLVAHLSNCIAGSSTISTKIKDTLIRIYKSGSAPSGNFTFQQILYALNSSGATVNDLCNPYVLDCNQFGTPPPVPVNDCLPSAFYADLTTFINRTTVLNALGNPGTGYSYTLDTTGNSFERGIARVLGNYQSTAIVASYTTSQKLYQLKVQRSAFGSLYDSVKVCLHSPVCGNIFSPSCTSSASVACINSSSSLISGTGLINEFSFIATITATCSGDTTTCIMPGWVDSMQTMTYMDKSLASCIPCTQLRMLYNQFNDTLLAYGIAGSDHPNYDVMLANYMNNHLLQAYTSTDYETFIQSCALADSIKMPLYTSYSAFTFTSTTAMNNFIDTLNSIDALYSFNNSYRDSTLDSSIITVCINLNKVPKYELWKYKAKLLAYGGSYHSRIIDAPLSSIKHTGEIGFIYSSDSLFKPDTLNIIDTTTVKFKYSQRAVWIGGHFVVQYYYDIIDTGGTPPYTISKDVYEISAYLYNHGVPGVVFTPCYQSTIDADYFKPEKQAYLKYTYGYQSLPSYQVIDSVQQQYLSSRISSYSGYLPGYSQSSTWGMFTNLYLDSYGMSNRLYDTLQHIFTLATNGTAGYIFHTVNDTVTYPTAPIELTAFICADGSYWYRYFTTKDTLFNVFVSFPAYIPKSLRRFYKEVALIPTPGDSMNRSFSLMLVRSTTSDTILANGRCSFVIGRSIELDNVLLGRTTGGVNLPGADTFNNCERQTLYTAINEGILNYNHYMDSVKNSITKSFTSYLATTVNEQLLLGYMNDEFDYTLYNYDRAGNLTFTVPPAGSASIATALLDSIDGTRTRNNPSICPPAIYYKQNVYNYNTYNQVSRQKTIDGGTTRFFYDVAGRLIFSQNARQAQNGYYTYNLYNNQSRIIETGEAIMGCQYFEQFLVPPPIPYPAHYYDYPVVISGTSYDIISPDPYFIQFLDQESADSIVSYVHTYDRHDVVMTIYDTAATNLGNIVGLDAQMNLRKRVAAVLYFDSLLVSDTTLAWYTYATHYSYDMEGNVQTLTQDFPGLEAIVKQRYKRIDYDYDLISGKVNMLSYNRGWPDQFYQKYSYDADNRITEVETSNDGWIWQQDATYAYYDHGPLARVQLGKLGVQGIDYAYTIQGWLKAVNCDTLNIGMDMGNDATPGSVVAKDAVAYTIDYFNNDYKPITSNAVQHVTPVSLNLFNGNIARQTVAIDTFQRLNKQYMYDQLNRIHSAAYASINPVNGTITGLTDFHSNYSYDYDGNLLSLVRYGNDTGTGARVMDSFTYKYLIPTNNQLTQIIENAPDGYSNDITYFPGPGPARYTYDPTGNTIADLVSGQDTIEWNLYNKVIRTVNNGDNSTMEFTYDGAGNRVKKSYTKHLSDTFNTRNDYYVHDAQGNVLAIYHERINRTVGSAIRLLGYNYSLAEHDIYGSSRLGVKEYYKGQTGIRFDFDLMAYTDTLSLWEKSPWYSLEYQDVIKGDSTNLYGNTFTDMRYARQTIGQKQYELTDHLGDVLATVSDKRVADSLAGSHTTGALDSIVTWKPIVVSATDYYPFGMQMPGRYMTDTATHCFYATITEMEHYFIYTIDTLVNTSPPVIPILGGNLTSTTTDMQINTTTTGDGASFTIDSLLPGFSQTITLIAHGVSPLHYSIKANIYSGGVLVGGPYTIANSGSTSMSFTPPTSTVTLDITQPPGALAGHINLHMMILPRDSLAPANVVTLVCNEDRYHYGYNGQMKNNQWAGLGNDYDFDFREYDARICRFRGVDPLAQIFVWNSSYAFAENRPIDGRDLEGLEWASANGEAEGPVDPQHIDNPNSPFVDNGNSGYNAEGAPATIIGAKPVTMKPASSYDYSKEVIPGKQKDDLNYIMHGSDGNPLSRWGKTIARDWNAPKNEDARETVNTLESLSEGLPIIGPVERRMSKTGKTVVKVFTRRALTKENFRYNLSGLTGEIPEGAEAHHVFPQAFESEFNQVGLNIHDPKFGAWWEAGEHGRRAYEYNQRWRAFLDTKPSQTQILDFGRKVMSDYNIPINY